MSSFANGLAKLTRIGFSDLKGWENEDHLAAFSCFRVSARRMAEKPYTTKALGINADDLAKAAVAALDLGSQAPVTGTKARSFFETWFDPLKIEPLRETDKGFVTGYFEPEIAASPVRTDKYKYPVLRRPDDLVAIDDSNRPDAMEASFFFARNKDGELSEYFDRKQIEQGALDGFGLEMFWLESRIDIFFIHIQGSARLLMPDGTVKRISYSGKTGHAFTAIGKILIDRGALTLEAVTMQSIRQWLEDHPHQADDLMWQNRSFIFFSEVDHPEPQMGPIAAAGVPLTPGRSLAVDHRLQTFGAPIWVTTDKPIPGSSKPFERLMIAQDTGSAIVGPARGDLFIGTGFEAGQIAGGVKNTADFTVFVPKPGRGQD